MLSRWTLALSVVLAFALLAARASLVPVTAFRERQWPLGADGTTGTLLRETRTRWARVVNETDATLARPGGLRIEWRGFLTAARGGSLGVVAESAGPATFVVDGRGLARVAGGAEARSSGSLPIQPGSHELVVTVDVPSRDAVGGARFEAGSVFHAVLRLPDGSAVPLEKAMVTTSPVSVAASEASRRFRSWADPALVILGCVALGGFLATLRRGSPVDRSLAEMAATVLVLAIALWLPHGSGLDLWGTFPWGGLPIVPRVALLLAGLLPWLTVLRARPVWLPHVAISPGAAAVVAFLVFSLLGERRFWGDAWITLRILEGHAIEGAFGPFFWKEPLDRILAIVATHGARLVGMGTAKAIAFTSCLAGALLVAAISVDRRRGGRDDWTAGALLTTGAMLVFFGHVENYSWVSATVVAFLLVATRVAAGEIAPAWAGATAGLAIAFHPVALFAVAPALLTLAAIGRKPHGVLELATSALVIPLALAFGCLAAGVDPPALGLNRFADDPAVLRTPAAALAPHALFGLANRLVLLLSPGIALALVAGVARAHRPSRESLPLVAAAAGALAQLVFLQGKIRPEVCDWDLFAPAAFPIAMLAGRALRGSDFFSTRLWCTGVSAAVLLLGVLGNLRG